MNYKSTVLITSIILLLVIPNLNAGSIVSESNTTVIYVNNKNTEGPWDGTKENPYQNIQDGIDASADEYTIFVFNGTYYEHILINKKVTLIGEEKSNTLIDGMYNGDAIHINHDYVNIINFTIRNSGGFKDDAGIKIGSDHNLIKNCDIYGTRTGIYSDDSDKTIINNCSIHTNGEGILLQESDDAVVEGCCFNHNSIGLNIDNSQYDAVKYSYFYANGIACLLNGSKNIEINHCNISDNSVNLGGVFIVDCLNINVINCNLRHNGAGLHIYSSGSIHVKHCNLNLNTHFALAMRTTSEDVVISECEIRNNFRYGLYIEEGNSCKLINSNICNNALYAIYSKFADCKARYNWWGSKLGPSYFDLGSGKRITLIMSKIKCLPWLLKPLENTGSNWEENKPYMNKKTNNSVIKQIDLPGEDTDADGVPDWWEEKWGYSITSYDDHMILDPDNDALNNFEECYTDQYGSNPFHKDIFVEIDWMKSQAPDTSNKPPVDLIQELVSIFEEQNITLHVDLGQLDGGEELPFLDTLFSFAKLRDAYWNFFLNNQTDNPRKGIFHYGIICKYCPDLNFPFFGWDNMDSFAVSAEWLKEKMPQISRGHLIIGAMIHHLGHSLGLLADTYGGIDNIGTAIPFSFQWLKYYNYKSCMHYGYKYEMFSYSDGTNGRGDFDDWGNLDFSFFKNSHFEWPKA